VGGRGLDFGGRVLVGEAAREVGAGLFGERREALGARSERVPQREFVVGRRLRTARGDEQERGQEA
jgi:hypothetical protein